MSPGELVKSVGIGKVEAKASEAIGHAITKWDVYYGGHKIGHIARSLNYQTRFYGYSAINPDAMKGTVFSVLRDAIRWLLLHSMPVTKVKWEYHDRLVKDAYVEESHETAKFSGLATKLQEWMGANGIDYGVRLNTAAGLAINLDYHENPFWINNPLENKLKRFLCKEGAELVKVDCTRWHVVDCATMVRETEELDPGDKNPKFVPYKSPVTGDEGMALYIGWPEAITQEQWAKISRLMQQKGYDMRGAADTQRAVYGFLQRFGKNVVPPVLKDWIDTLSLVLGVKAPSQPPAAKTAGATPASKVFRRATREWGVTADPASAGYILPSGAMLDLSGARQGGSRGVRAYDHRQVAQFFDEHFDSATAAMHAFMDLGAIRWMPEGNSLDIRQPPTPQQLTTLRRILGMVQGNIVYVDVYWPNYGASAAEYPGRTSPDRIVRDIQTFYKTGEMKKMSQVQQFHMAAESAIDAITRNGVIPFNASPVAQGIALALLDAEQMELPLDNDDPVFGSPEEIGAWLDKIGVTKGYTQIGGDFGDPWLYGGTWFSKGIENDPGKWASVIHIDGLEGSEKKDYDSRSDAVLKLMDEDPRWRDKVAARVAEILPQKLIDQGNDGQPADDPETVEWCREEATDEARDEVGELAAAHLNNSMTVSVYRTNAEDPNEESWVVDRLDDLLSTVGVTREQWDNVGPEGRTEIVGDAMGWHELDHQPDEMTKQELSAYLGIEL
jgi:hypothetical protein